jgi:YfiR/HmsC-like
MSVVRLPNYRYVHRVGTASLRLRSGIRLLVAGAVLLCEGALWAQSASEYEIKAAFLYKFASFVQWPAPAPGTPPAGTGPICIGVLGADRFGPSLDQVVRGKLVSGRGFTVGRFQSPNQALHCDIVFISSSEQSRMSEILLTLRGKPVLTVSEVPGFCEKGGLVNLKVVDSAVRFEINVTASEHAGLHFSSKLLNLAKIVAGASP